MHISARVFKKLQAITGKPYCKIEKEDLACYAYDAITRDVFPDVVVFPENTGEVSEILTLASREKIPVVPRGSGTGTTGGSLALSGGIVLVMTRMNRIIHIDRDNFVARVEPGVITGDLHNAVEAVGLFYPPDPSSASFSTLGGNVAECAGGPRAVKYGVTRDYVLGLTAVLATGEVIKTGVQTAKGVVGYDLTRLIIGSEGTLAVVTEMTLKLLPLPGAVMTVAVVFDSMDKAAFTVTEIIRSGIIPRCVEYLDKASIACVQSYANLDLPIGAEALLIIETDGRRDAAEYDLRCLTEICRKNDCILIKTAESKEEKDALWAARKAVSPSLYMYGPDKINEDIVVPRSRIPEMVKMIETLRKDSGLTMVSFGHAGDGNIHVNIMLDKGKKGDLEKAEYVVDRIFDETLSLGGTLSGEHGVGITKLPYISKEIGQTERLLMQQIKTVFDPHNILNPGKIFG
ncbi:MAG: FAD-binding protein [Proteobacteria bacterium]|nr:FAD-binding protein [Pseudomonadota bacterium]